MNFCHINFVDGSLLQFSQNICIFARRISMRCIFHFAMRFVLVNFFDGIILYIFFFVLLIDRDGCEKQRANLAQLAIQANQPLNR